MICQNELRVAGKAYPRTCPRCGLGPCNSGWLEKIKVANDERDRLTVTVTIKVSKQRKGKRNDQSQIIHSS